MVEDLELNQRIAQRLRQLRSDRGLSLDALAQRSGVSRSMISLVERGEASPTAVLLEKLATALDCTLVQLFQPPAAAQPQAEPAPLVRRAQQLHWVDPASGYARRNLTPPGLDTPLQLVEVDFPPGASVAFETAQRQPLVHQQVWLVSGAMSITVGAEVFTLAAGDCLAMQLDQPIGFHNPGPKPARYLVALHHHTSVPPHASPS